MAEDFNMEVETLNDEDLESVTGGTEPITNSGSGTCISSTANPCENTGSGTCKPGAATVES